KAKGIQPPKSKREKGWEVEDRPPADWFNWQMNRTYEALQELQEKAVEKVDFDNHVADNAKHIHANERQSWNRKETPEGAQAKANQAETNAKNASVPRTGGTLHGDLTVTNTLKVAGQNVIAELNSVKQSGVDARNLVAGAI